jgi:pimeloyl-ACP methyl ester carboxylesterase
LADNRSAFAVLRRSLRKRGFADVHPFDHNPFGGDVRGKAELLDACIADVCARTGAPQVDVVGHSLGGLIARYHAQVLDRSGRVRTVVTLGTPHGGTLAAQLLRAHPLVRELCPDSPVVAELARPAEGCRTRFVAYWGDLDPFVLPFSSGAIRHPDLDATNIRVPGAGHLTLPSCRTVAAGIAGLCVPFTGAAAIMAGADLGLPRTHATTGAGGHREAREDCGPCEGRTSGSGASLEAGGRNELPETTRFSAARNTPCAQAA